VFFPCWARNSLLGPDSLLCQRGRAGGPSRESGPAGNSGRSEGLLPAGPSKEFRAQQGENTNPPKSLSVMSDSRQRPCQNRSSAKS
jgi:hypothetical protein